MWRGNVTQIIEVMYEVGLEMQVRLLNLETGTSTLALISASQIRPMTPTDIITWRKENENRNS